VAAAVALLLALHAGLAVHSLWIKSVAYDETSHLPAGLAAVATGEPVLNPQHPPLVKLLAGLAASTAQPTLPLDGAAYRHRAEWDFGRRVLFASGIVERALVRRGRLPVVALSVIGALAVFAWSRRRFGTGAGLFSLALYAFSPTVLAHSRLVTFDAPLAALGVAALYVVWRARPRTAEDPAGEPSAPRGGRWLARELGVGALLGLVTATKFSGLVLVALAVACDLVVEAASRGGGAGWRRLAAGWAVRLAAVAVVLQAVYLSPLGPLRWLEGAGRIYADIDPGHPFYLAGRFSRDGFAHYFLVAMAVKSTLVELGAGLFGLGRAAIACLGPRRGPGCGSGWRDDLYLWLPAAGWVAATSALALDLGVRYVLPAYPLLFVLAGALVPAAGRWSPRLGPALVVVLGLGQAATALGAHPDYIPYFNRLAGGTAAGPRWLDDSNLDWGQDLGRLPGWLAERGISRVALFYFGTGDPGYYGVPAAPMPASDWEGSPRPGAYVISAHRLVQGLWRARNEGVATDWLDRYTPEDVLGGTLYLYLIRPQDDGRPAAAGDDDPSGGPAAAEPAAEPAATP
jgi:hypothetical protein